jgi:hypothetical protein
LATSIDAPAARARLVLAALAVLPFAPSLGHPFFADDWIHLERARALLGAAWKGLAEGWVLRAADAAAWWSPPDLSVPYFRPLVTLAFLADTRVWGLSASGFHLTNVVLHAATTLLVFGIARRLLPAGAFAAAALFALHPCHLEAVAWVSGRTDLLAGAASAAAILLYLASRQHTTRRPALLAASLVALAAALLAKESAAAVPLVLLLYEAVVPAAEPVRRRLAGPLLAVLVVAAYVAVRLAVLGRVHLPPHPFAHRPGDTDFAAHVVMAPFLYLADLALFVPPDPAVTLPWWRAHPMLFAALAVSSVAVFASSLRRVREPWLRAFGLGWIALTLLPAAPLSVGERFLYVPSIGYCLLLGAGAGALLARDPARERRRLVLIGAVVAVVALARTVGFGRLAGHAHLAVDDARTALRAHPDRSLVLVTDLPPAAALGFAHALRLERPRLEVEVLSLAPRFASADPAASSVVTSSPDGLALRRAAPYLEGYVERAYLGERAPLAPGDVVERPSFAVTIREAAGTGVRAFDVRLRPEALPRCLLLRGRGWRLEADPACAP